MIRHEQRGEFFFIYWRGLRFQEMKPNLVYLFVMDIPKEAKRLLFLHLLESFEFM